MKHIFFLLNFLFLCGYLSVNGMEGSSESTAKESHNGAYTATVETVVAKITKFDGELYKAFQEWPDLYNDHPGYEKFKDFMSNNMPIDFTEKTRLLAQELDKTPLPPKNDPLTSVEYKTHLFIHALHRLYFYDGQGKGDLLSCEIEPYFELSPEARHYLKKYFLTIGRGSTLTAFDKLDQEQIQQRIGTSKNWPGMIAMLTTTYHDQEALQYHEFKQERVNEMAGKAKRKSFWQGLAGLFTGIALGVWEFFFNQGSSLDAKTTYQVAAGLSFFGGTKIAHSIIQSPSQFKRTRKAHKWQKRIIDYALPAFLFNKEDFDDQKHFLGRNLYQAAKLYSQIKAKIHHF